MREPPPPPAKVALWCGKPPRVLELPQLILFAEAHPREVAIMFASERSVRHLEAIDRARLEKRAATAEWELAALRMTIADAKLKEAERVNREGES